MVANERALDCDTPVSLTQSTYFLTNTVRVDGRFHIFLRGARAFHPSYRYANKPPVDRSACENVLLLFLAYSLYISAIINTSELSMSFHVSFTYLAI